MDHSKILITGANGQLSRALKKLLPEATALSREELNIADRSSFRGIHWEKFRVIINAAAYTKVDLAQTKEGQIDAAAVNVRGVENLIRIAQSFGLILVHISTEYVFDGMHDGPIPEDLRTKPLSVYGRTKEFGERLVQKRLPNHYLVRTSWVVGDGANFVRTMQGLAAKGVEPKVVNDQIGRLTFAEDLAKGIVYLLDEHAPFGTYNLTNEGEPASWAEVARTVYQICGHSRGEIKETTTAEYFADKPEAAPRPLNSVLDLKKIESAGFKPRDWRVALSKYLAAS